eukprot:562674_1
MASKIQMICVILLVLCTVSHYISMVNPPSLCIRENYFADPCITFESLSAKPFYFKRFTNMTVDVFVSRLLSPIFERMKLPRDFWQNNVIRKCRRAQIHMADRVVRACMVSRGVKLSHAAFFSNQATTTVAKDVKHVARIIVTYLSNQYLYLPPVDGPEYNALKGAGNFVDFPQAVYAGDVTKIRIPRPVKDQELFYDGHHHMHSVGFLCFIDGNGVCRGIHGPSIGRKNDIQIWCDSVWCEQVHDLVAAGDLILFDGAFRYVDDIFLVPFPQPIDPNSRQRDWNRMQSKPECWWRTGLGYLNVIGVFSITNIHFDAIVLVYSFVVVLS